MKENKISTNHTVHYYHFTAADTLRDGRPVPPVGKWLEHTGDIVPCESGLHASKHPFDALQYAAGNRLHLVELGGEIVPHGNDKVCARRRKIVKSSNAEPLLRAFARRVALDVLPLWQDAPAVVREYLETGGDKSKRASARAAAWASASASARDAAWASAWDAARAAARAAYSVAARVAARASAWDAAWDAAWASAWDAAQDAAWASAWASAWDAARAAARAAAWDAAWASAWDAASVKYRDWFKEMVDAEFAREAKAEGQ